MSEFRAVVHATAQTLETCIGLFMFHFLMNAAVLADASLFVHLSNDLMATACS